MLHICQILRIWHTIWSKCHDWFLSKPVLSTVELCPVLTLALAPTSPSVAPGATAPLEAAGSEAWARSPTWRQSSLATPGVAGGGGSGVTTAGGVETPKNAGRINVLFLERVQVRH